MSDISEHQKLRMVKDSSQAIGEFFEWLAMEKGFTLGKWHGNYLEPARYTMTNLLAEFYQIDLDRLEAEKLAIFQEQELLNQRTAVRPTLVIFRCPNCSRAEWFAATSQPRCYECGGTHEMVRVTGLEPGAVIEVPVGTIQELAPSKLVLWRCDDCHRSAWSYATEPPMRRCAAGSLKLMVRLVPEVGP